MADVSHVLLVHGWSADDASMANVARLAREAGYETVDIYLGAYPSLDDVVQAEDSARRMAVVIEELHAQGKLEKPFHVIVHSTGAFIVRQWLADAYPASGSPVRNFLMLAPANYGSPLAHLGRTALGRFLNIGKNGWQTGIELLHQLELGSRYQEQLALRDRLNAEGTDSTSPFSDSANGTRPFVIVGLKPVPAVSVLDEWAWDGTVRAASAHFDPRGVTIDFARKTANGQPTITRWTPRGIENTAFAVLPDHTHLSIIKPRNPNKSHANDAATKDRLADMILEALAVKTPAQYRKVVEAWRTINNETRVLAQNTPEAEALRQKILKRRDRIPRRYNEHYQVVVQLEDDFGQPVTDYYVWFGAPSKSEDLRHLNVNEALNASEIFAHEHVIVDAHKNRRNPERRVLHLDRMELMRSGGFFDRGTAQREKALAIGLTAVAPGEAYSFFHEDERRGSELITLRAPTEGGYDDPDRFLKRYATHFVRVIAPRHPHASAFSAKPLTAFR